MIILFLQEQGTQGVKLHQFPQTIHPTDAGADIWNYQFWARAQGGDVVPEN